MLVETVEEHCTHKDCSYRCHLLSYNCDYCNYAVMEGELRGCPISQCTRYTNKPKKVTMTGEGIWFTWILTDEEE